MNIFIVCCGEQKVKTSEEIEARLLYTSNYFKYKLEYAILSNGEDNTYILSTQYGIIPLNQKIKYYEKAIDDMSETEKNKWGNLVVEQLKQIANLQNDNFVILASERYIEPFGKYIKNIERPLRGRGGFNEQIIFLKKEISLLEERDSNNGSI
jgi:cytoplasmic iron level regulating protein YaaA (DUF328/UPF0246 family)